MQNPTLVVEEKPVVRFRLRGWGQKEIDDPRLVNALLRGGTASNAQVVESLIREGLFVAPSDVPRTVRFAAELSFRLPGLFPRSAKRETGEAQVDWGLNPKIYWQRFSTPPAPIRDRVWKANLLAKPPLIWIEDPATRALFPYWPDQAVSECLTQLTRGQLRPADLTPSQRFVLASARVLVSREDVEHPGRTWERRCHELSEQLAGNQYLVLRDLFGPLQIAHLRRYFREIEKEGYLNRADTQVERRHFMYREPLSNSIHGQLVPLLSKVTGESLKASYSYFGVYLPGAVLDRHKDRSQCRWNLSVIWDTRTERNRSNAWPLYLEAQGRARKVSLGMGDGVLYRGTELFHWRDKQPPKNSTTATFFHFVHQNFKGSLD